MAKSAAPASTAPTPISSTEPVSSDSSSNSVSVNQTFEALSVTNTVDSTSATASVKSHPTTLSDSVVSDPFSCDVCGFHAVSSVGLKIHKSRKHEDIPQIDGASFSLRETDPWWERNLKQSLRSYQMYIDVLKDIEEANLSEEEEILEKENVTNVRKEALGKIFMECPPWNTM